MRYRNNSGKTLFPFKSLFLEKMRPSWNKTKSRMRVVKYYEIYANTSSQSGNGC